MRIGIPRALFFYHLYPQWKAFFTSLGWEVVTSPESNRKIVEDGIMNAVSEACYPVKVLYGHVIYLAAQRVDWIFVPRLVSLESKAYICPKFMGLPDMLKAQLPGIPPVLDLCIDFSRSKRPFKESLMDYSKLLGHKPRGLERAWQESDHAYREFCGICRQGYTAREAIRIWEGEKTTGSQEKTRKIGVLGHCYNIHDEIISMGLIKQLAKMGFKPVTREMRDQTTIDKAAAALPKRMFWTEGKNLLGTALDMDLDDEIEGMVFLTCFGCGPDSMVARLIERRVTRKPFMVLTVDEHSGEAGLITRLEAFCDMLGRRTINEDYLSPHGECIYRY